MYLDKNAILSNLSKDDIIKIVCSLGSLPPKIDNNNNLVFQTICHNKPDPNNSWKLYYYHPDTDHSYGIFHCYSGCQDSFNIIELVIRANRAKGITITWYKALQYIGELTNNLVAVSDKNLRQDNYLIDDWSFINKFKTKDKRDIPTLKTIDEHVLEMFDYTPHEMFLSDHISREVLSEFEISYWGKTNQIIIPHRDRYQHLIGIRGRYIDEADVREIGKYVPLSVEEKILSHSLGSNLYGIHINQEKIQKCKKCMLLEGEKGVMQNHTYFSNDDFALAVCGSNISLTQIKLLLNYLQVEEVIIGFDKMFHENETYEEEIYRNKIYKKVTPLLPYCKVSLLWDKHNLIEYKQSPTDYGKDVLLQLLDEKIEITMNDIKMIEGEEEMGN